VAGTATNTNSGGTKTAQASCPGGRFVLGGGYVITGSGIDLETVSRNQAIDDSTWQVDAQEINGNGNTGSWALQAFAICATASP
jgi:hypothetical protein